MQAKLQSCNKNRYHFCFRYHQGNIYVIDVSQSVEHDHVHALEFLRKDCTKGCHPVCQPLKTYIHIITFFQVDKSRWQPIPKSIIV
jgi:hypothetical protein